MSSSEQAKQALNDHANAIDTLHHKLAALPGAAKDRLQTAVDKYKKAHQAFHDDALECMN